MTQHNADRRPVPVIYTMGKVASTSIAAAMDRAGFDSYHIHSLAPRHLKSMALQHLNRGRFPPPHISAAMTFRNELLAHPDRCLYISAVRDPLSRNLSAYFGNLKRQDRDIWAAKDAAWHFSVFVKKYPHDVPLTWFDREFRAQLGIDIYKHDFDRERRYSYYPEIRTVLFRVDCPDEVKGSVLSEIMGCKITVERENDSEQRDYVDLYRQVLDLAAFDNGFSAEAYSSRFCRHFWTADELEKMEARWRR